MEHHYPPGTLLFKLHQSYHRPCSLSPSEKSTKDVLIVGCSTDDFLCAYYSTHLLQDFLSVINKYSPVTYKEGLELSYLKLHTIHSPHGIIIDHTYHTKDAILARWFPDVTEQVNSDTAPFKAYINFGISLEDTIPSNPAELHHLEELYLGKFSAHIGNFLHIMQHNRPYIMYIVNCLSTCAAAPYAPKF